MTAKAIDLSDKKPKVWRAQDTLPTDGLFCLAFATDHSERQWEYAKGTEHLRAVKVAGFQVGISDARVAAPEPLTLLRALGLV